MLGKQRLMRLKDNIRASRARAIQPDLTPDELGSNSTLYFIGHSAFEAAKPYLSPGHSGVNYTFKSQTASYQAMWVAIGLAAVRAHQVCPFKPIRTAPVARPILVYIDGDWRKFVSTPDANRMWHCTDGYCFPHAEALEKNLVWSELPSTPHDASTMTLQSNISSRIEARTAVKAKGHPFTDPTKTKLPANVVVKPKVPAKAGAMKVRG